MKSCKGEEETQLGPYVQRASGQARRPGIRSRLKSKSKRVRLIEGTGKWKLEAIELEEEPSRERAAEKR